MGKFINTSYYDGVDSVVDINKNLINNPFYIFSDKKPTKVDYYNINTAQTTLDPSSKLQYDNIGKDSPIRFNLIHGFYIYQFQRVELNLDNGDYGLENGSIEGESYILPNTIKPIPGDYFEVSHIRDSTWLFRVNEVDRDTLDDGSNVWKINWSLDRTSNRDILENIVEEYQFLNVQEGTNTSSIVKLDKYELAKQIDELTTSLREYFIDLFYSDRIQTFTYKWYNEYAMYDDFAIEFIIRNKLLSDNKVYTYVQHQIQLPKTFAIDYNRSIYRAFELCDKDKIESYIYQSQADHIDDVTSIFNTRVEDYFALNYHVYYNEQNTPMYPRGIIPILDQDFISAIHDEKYYKDNCSDSYKNIIVKYFNKKKIKSEDIECINCIDYQIVKDTFYQLLFLIFCLDKFTQQLLS